MTDMTDMHDDDSRPPPRSMALTPPGLADIEALARDAFDTIPQAFLSHVEGVAIHVADFPDDETMTAMALETPFDLLGLYHGVSIDQRSVLDSPHDLDRIFLYRRPILDYWAETEEPLDAIIRHVLIHEIGHHFGLSDAEMEALETQAEDDDP